MNEDKYGLRKFVGRHNLIPYGRIVQVIDFLPKRRAVVEYNGKVYFTFSTLLRKDLSRASGTR